MVTAAFSSQGGVITVVADGYLPRVARSTTEPFYLWPQDEAYVRALVYGNTPPVLYRWTHDFTIETTPDLTRIVTSALVEIHAATQLSASFQTPGDVVIRIDPSDPYFDDKPTVTGYARIRSSGNGALIGGVIAFRDDATPAIAMLHELGHAVGLTHSPRLDDVMYATTQRTRSSEFSERELIALRLMYRRRAPGNTAPDSEAGVSATSVRTLVIVD